MTTLTKLKKLSKNRLTKFLTEQGFEVVNPLMFFRKGPEDIYQVLLFELSYSQNLKVSALCHTKEMDDLIPCSFPESVSVMVGGEIEPGEPIAYENGYIWDIETETNAISCLEKIQECIIESAFPFFEEISTRRKMVDFIYPSMLVGDYKVVAEKILDWNQDD